MNNDLGQPDNGLPTITRELRDAMRMQVVAAVERGSVPMDNAGELMDMLGIRGAEMLHITERMQEARGMPA